MQVLNKVMSCQSSYSIQYTHNILYKLVKLIYVYTHFKHFSLKQIRTYITRFKLHIRMPIRTPTYIPHHPPLPPIFTLRLKLSLIPRSLGIQQSQLSLGRVECEGVNMMFTILLFTRLIYSTTTTTISTTTN